MISILYYILTTLTTATAESTVIQAFNGPQSQPTLPISALQASIVSANALATTLALQCKPDAWDPLCTVKSNPPTITITEGPSTFTMSAVYPTKSAGVDGVMTLVQGCNITSSTKGAGCSVDFTVDLSGSATGSGGVTGAGTGTKTATSTSLQTRLREDEIYYRPVTVTAGVEKLNAPEATQMPGAGSGGGSGTGAGGIGGVAAAAVAAAAMLI